MISSAKEVRELLSKSPNPPTKPFLYWYQVAVAEGYLVCLEGPEVKALVEALERVRVFDSPIYKGNHAHPLAAWQIVAHEALARYREAVKK